MSDWNPRANEIFLAALELASGEDRRALIEEQCGGDKLLREQVDSLLEASEKAGSFLEDPLLQGTETELRDECDLDFLNPCESPECLGRLGEYDITHLIGRGGMGVVLRGQDAQLNRVVAIKVLAPELAGNATARRRFLREAQAAAAVTHQQVVTIHAVGEDKLPYLVMEYVEGQSLQEKIEREGTLRLDEILRIGSQVATGLAAAHAQGLIHRDIKPANILLENGVERVRITDFGLARAVDDATITRQGEVTGTPQYMSPEQAHGHSVDARSDLFSLGCVMYAMCTGRSPFRADSTVAAIRRVCEETPRPIRDINPEVPRWLAGIIDRLLEKNPDDRIQSAGETTELLGQCLAHVQDPGSTSLPKQLGQSSHPRKRRRKRTFVLAAALLVVVSFVIAEMMGIINSLEFLKSDSTDPVQLAAEGYRSGSGESSGTGELATDPEPDAAKEQFVRLPPVDLLRLIDPDQHSRTGRWRFEEDTLVSPGTGRWDRLDIPCPTQAEYDLEVTAERKSGEDMLSISLVSGDRQFFVGLDMFEGRYCGLGLLDGKDAYANETTIERGVFNDRRPHKIVCQVRNDRVGVLLDGETIIEWHGSLDRLSIPEYGRTGTFGLMAMRSEYFFYDIILQPLRVKENVSTEFATVRRFEGHTGPVKQIAVSPDGTLALSGSGYPQGDGSVRLWEIETGKEIRTLKTSGTQMMTVCFSPDGRRAAASGFGGVIQIWEVETGREITSFQTNTEIVEDLEFSPDGRQLLCATHKRRLPLRLNMSGFTEAQLWDIETEELVWQYDCDGWLAAVAFLPDGEQVAVAGNVTGNAIQFLDRNSGKRTRHLNFGDPAHIHIEDLAVSPDGRFIATAEENGYVILWDVKEGGDPVKYRSNMGNVRSVTFSPDSGSLLCGAGEGEYGSLQLLRVPTLQTIASVENSSGLVWHVAFMPDGIHALSAGGYAEKRSAGDYSLQLWRLPMVELTPGPNAEITVLRRFEGHTGPVKQVAFSPDGTLALSGSGLQGDGSVRLWEVATGREIHSFMTSDEQILSVCFSPDGQRAAGGGFGGVVDVWDVAGCRHLTAIKTDTEVVDDLAFSMDGDRLLCVTHKRTLRRQSYSEQGAVQLWNIDTQELLWQDESAEWATTGDFLRNGGRVVVAGRPGGVIRVLDPETGNELERWESPRGEAEFIEELAVSGDGRFVATVSRRGTLCLWDVNADGNLVQSTGDTGRLMTVAFSPDGRRLLTGGDGNTILLLEVPSLRRIATVDHPSGVVWHVAFAPDGRHALSAGGHYGNELSGDYALRLWSLPESEQLTGNDAFSIEQQIADLTRQIGTDPANKRLRISRAHLFIRQRDLHAAAADFRAAGETIYDRPGDVFGYAIVLVHLGEYDLHRQLCDELLSRHAQTRDEWTANCVVKACLLRSGVIDPMKLPVELLSADREYTTDLPPWVLREARALIAYRSGEFEECRRQVRETMALAAYKDDPLYAPRALSILAMATYRSGDEALARDLFEQATKRFEEIELAPGHPGTIGWLYADILRREAEQLLTPDETNATTNTDDK